MNPSKDISDQILKFVEEASQEISNSHKSADGNDSMASTAQHFLKVWNAFSHIIFIHSNCLFLLKLFSTNLTTAINIVYFKDDDQAADHDADLNQNNGIKSIIYLSLQCST